MTVYHNAEEPGDEAANYILQSDESRPWMKCRKWLPQRTKTNKVFNNMLVGFSGILLASYSEAKQNNDAAALATSKKLAGMLIEMVLKTNPENLRIENGQIVMK